MRLKEPSLTHSRRTYRGAVCQYCPSRRTAHLVKNSFSHPVNLSQMWQPCFCTAAMHTCVFQGKPTCQDQLEDDQGRTDNGSPSWNFWVSSLLSWHLPCPQKWPNQRLIIPRPSCTTCHLLNEKNRGRERLIKISHDYQSWDSSSELAKQLTCGWHWGETMWK